MDFMTPEMFNILIIMNLIVGIILATLRFRQDMTRPLRYRSRRPSPPSQTLDDDTQPNLKN